MKFYLEYDIDEHDIATLKKLKYTEDEIRESLSEALTISIRDEILSLVRGGAIKHAEETGEIKSLNFIEPGWLLFIFDLRDCGEDVRKTVGDWGKESYDILKNQGIKRTVYKL